MLKIGTYLRTTNLILSYLFLLNKEVTRHIINLWNVMKFRNVPASGSSCELTITAVRRTQAKTNWNFMVFLLKMPSQIRTNYKKNLNYATNECSLFKRKSSKQSENKLYGLKKSFEKVQVYRTTCQNHLRV